MVVCYVFPASEEIATVAVDVHGAVRLGRATIPAATYHRPPPLRSVFD